MTQHQILAKVERALASFQKHLETLKKPAGGEIVQEEALTLHQKAHDALEALDGPAATKQILQRVRKDYHTHSNYGRIYQALEYRKRKFGDVDRRNGTWSIKSRTH